MTAFLELVLRQRVLVIAFACLLAAAGVYAFRTIAIDAFPDVTTVLVQVVTEAQGLLRRWRNVPGVRRVFPRYGVGDVVAKAGMGARRIGVPILLRYRN